MEGPGAPGGLEAIARHDLQRAFPQTRAVGRKENLSVPRGDLQRGQINSSKCFSTWMPPPVDR